MTSVEYFLDNQPAWHWWALGAILLAIEIASTTQYLLWPGLAALIVGLLKFLDPSLDGRLAIFLFAVISVIATAVWKRSAWGRAERDTHATLNDRSALYIGRTVKAAENFSNGRGAVLIDDTRWNATVTDGSSPMKGDMLRVLAADGTDLKVQSAT